MARRFLCLLGMKKACLTTASSIASVGEGTTCADRLSAAGNRVVARAGSGGTGRTAKRG
jgi:hypothetical protein